MQQLLHELGTGAGGEDAGHGDVGADDGIVPNSDASEEPDFDLDAVRLFTFPDVADMYELALTMIPARLEYS